jgi:uncharacterized membrane protein/nitrite reductase/ring-hydroxylating ferredoxin subunit
MRSKASFKSHPIHPMLVAFPIAFFTGALVFDTLSLVLDNQNLWTVGYYSAVAGIIGAVLAAIPGTIDYFNTVPPDSSGKKRATKHALINVTNLVLFIVVVFYRSKDNFNPTIVIVLEAIGFILLSFAGWLGGTLVYRNQIGVDPRYAQAGKWIEASFPEGKSEYQVATSNELKENQMKLVHIGNKRIVIARSQDGYVAFDDRCTHKGGSLAGGAMICGTVQCPWHGSQFDVTTGEVKAGPAKQKIGTYTVTEQKGKIILTFDQ